MSEPAKHDDAWGEVPGTEQEKRRSAGKVSAVSPLVTNVNRDLELPEHATPGELGAWPARTTAPSSTPTADRAGYALGKATRRTRELRVRLQNEVHDRLDDFRSRFHVIRGRTSTNAQETTTRLKHEAMHNLERARSRAQFYAHEYPIHFVLGAAGTAFLLGFVLGFWRQSE